MLLMPKRLCYSDADIGQGIPVTSHKFACFRAREHDGFFLVGLVVGKQGDKVALGCHKGCSKMTDSERAASRPRFLLHSLNILWLLNCLGEENEFSNAVEAA